MYGGILGENDAPRKHIVDVIRQLKEFGHHITVSSSRGRTAQAVKDLMEQLDRSHIQYDEIELHDVGKDYSVLVGSYVCDAHGDLHSALGLPCELYSSDVVQPRYFNELKFTETSVIKRSDIETLSGESFYYENIPQALAKLFPKLLEKQIDDDGRLCITVSKLEGTTFSQLSVNRCVHEPELRSLLSAIQTLHSHHNTTTVETGKVNYYENYATKVERRFYQHHSLYERIHESEKTIPCYVDSIISALKEYEITDRSDIRHYIHGDPVFSNCLHTLEGDTQFLDMNGKLGNVLTTAGDCTYDLAKILQSLFGYDYILLDVPINEADAELLSQLRKYFKDHVFRFYPKILWQDIVLVTASLYVSLIPLHNNFSHQVKFWRMGRRVYDAWKDITGGER